MDTRESHERAISTCCIDQAGPDGNDRYDGNHDAHGHPVHDVNAEQSSRALDMHASSSSEMKISVRQAVPLVSFHKELDKKNESAVSLASVSSEI
jgi:hypothetical protein